MWMKPSTMKIGTALLIRKSMFVKFENFSSFVLFIKYRKLILSISKTLFSRSDLYLHFVNREDNSIMEVATVLS